MAVCLSAGSVSSLAQGETPLALGRARQVEWTTSHLVGTPDPPPPYSVTRVFPRRKFRNPVFIAQEPGTTRLLVAELEGKIYAFDKYDTDGDATDVFLDLGRQIYAFSLHPRYAENGQVFVFCPFSADKQLSCVSRFQTNLSGQRRCESQSEQVIITWPSGGHNGGEAIIGPDGYLYISTGDSTSGSDPKGTGQGVDDLLSVIMRIDVEHPRDGQAYSVPADNPFVSLPGARPEIWAFGFRNPWRMSFDSSTGRLWVGDVGQDLWEMIWVVTRGGNYGWSVQEGGHPFHPHKPSGPGPILPPVMEHQHTECRSITGGYVYHGEKFPELNDVYIYGDYQYGKIWGLRYDGRQVTLQRELADTALQIPGFAVGSDGEFLVLDHLAGGVYELAKAEVPDTSASFPRRLSETGLLCDTARHQLAAGVVPYSVNTPQWLDGASAERFFGIRAGSTIGFVERSTDEKTWSFADGAVTAQTISIELEAGNPVSRRRLETRVMVKQHNHWLGYSYLWNDDQRDAELVPAAGATRSLTVQDAEGAVRKQTWKVPSRNECMVCHSRAAGFVLGLNTLQMNRQHDYGQVRENQLRALAEAAYFDRPLAKSCDRYAAMPNAYDPSADLRQRARAYLHVNCSVCHVSDGGGNARFQVRYDLDDEKLKLIDEPPIHGTFELQDGRLIAAGDPFASVLFYRLSKTGRGRMPHVGSQTLDTAGIRLIRDWILSLDQSDNSRYVREEIDELSAELSGGSANDAQRSSSVNPAQLGSTRRALLISDLLLHDAGLRSANESLIAAAVTDSRQDIRDLFERFLPESERTKTLGDGFDQESVLQRQGDPERGRMMFFGEGGTQCKNCHRVGGQGSDFGPDLSQIGSKYDRRQLLDTIATPSLRVEPEYVTQVVVTQGGQVYSGLRTAADDDQHVRLKIVRGNEVELVTIARADIEEQTTQPTSLMPERLLRDLTAQQAADLVDYLATLR
jgi:uncharacterized repeat protein (TIGR03806 family)